MARDFDLGMTGPPMYINMDFIAGGLVQTSSAASPPRRCSSATPGGRRSCSAGAWLATHWLLRESAVWKDRNTAEVREAQRHAEYAYRLAVDPPAAKELRLFGLADWVMERFVARRTRLHELQYQATRLREKPLLWSLLLVPGGQRRRVLVARRPPPPRAGSTSAARGRSRRRRWAPARSRSAG